MYAKLIPEHTHHMNRTMDLGHFCYVLLFHVTETTCGVSASNVRVRSWGGRRVTRLAACVVT